MTARMPTRRVRTLHAGAWWVWALGLAAAATRTLNPLVVGAVIAVAAVVVAARRSEAPWVGSFRAFIVLGAFVVVLRVVFEALFGPEVPGQVLVTLPQATLPDWLAGARLGGPVTLEAVVAALYAGLQLAAVLACLGAASALAAPTRLLKSVPGALYEVGVAAVVALTVVPTTLTHVRQLREARRLRGRTQRGARAWAAVAVAALNGALEQCLGLAAALDSKGYGRSHLLTSRERRLASGSVLLGLFGVTVGLYGLLAASTSGPIGLSLLIAGVALMVFGMSRAGRRSRRTVYRPDPWGLREWLCAASGLVAAVTVGVAAASWPDAGSPSPSTWPPLPILPLLGVLVGLVPAWVAPAPAGRSPSPPSPRPVAPRLSAPVGPPANAPADEPDATDVQPVEATR